MGTLNRGEELLNLEVHISQTQTNVVNLLLKALALLDRPQLDFLFVSVEWEKIEDLATELVDRLENLRHTEEI